MNGSVIALNGGEGGPRRPCSGQQRPRHPHPRPEAPLSHGHMLSHRPLIRAGRQPPGLQTMTCTSEPIHAGFDLHPRLTAAD